MAISRLQDLRARYTLAAPLPAGVAGELYVSGVQVARGYLGQPALTVDVVLSRDPFGAAGRACCTARVTWRPVDRRAGASGVSWVAQMTSRSRSVGSVSRLGEIEAALTRWRDVSLAQSCCSRSFVTITSGDQRSRCIRRAGRPAPSVSDPAQVIECRCRSFLTGVHGPRLGVCGTRFDSVDHRTGKTDHQGVCRSPVVAELQGVPGADRRPSKRLSRRCSPNVLGVAAVLVCDDDFFELGGNSLIATQCRRLGWERRSMLQAFRFVRSSKRRPLQSLAVRLEFCTPVRGSPPPLTGAAASGQLGSHLSLAQQRMWFLNQVGYPRRQGTTFRRRSGFPAPWTCQGLEQPP